MTRFLTIKGDPSAFERSMLVRKVEPAEVRAPLEPGAFERERVKARSEGKLVEFYQQAELSRLHVHFVEGDEVWEYNNLGPLSGSAGYVLIRGDVAVACVATLRS